ncbi:putative nuclease HARBI1 [Rhipicephalus sanguineus]|uniref:putative nuclease HARBI1 n=1 Tax=Rhipicephalus sanguineus TaxID=34632 RepID=UPI0020C27E54|nr:putative nuclease HARBI1 [Rhipicephalus sanguineus]
MLPARCRLREIQRPVAVVRQEHAITVVRGQKRWVAFSGDHRREERTKAAFARLGQIPVVVGCVDGTLIAIPKPHGLSSADTTHYMSGKGLYAFNTTITCDADLWMSVHVSWGHVITSGYGGGALSVSTWKQNFGLLGDSSYTLEPWFPTPVPGRPARGTPDNHYNKAHTAMRNVVEWCIAVSLCTAAQASLLLVQLCTTLRWRHMSLFSKETTTPTMLTAASSS